MLVDKIYGLYDQWQGSGMCECRLIINSGRFRARGEGGGAF